MHPDRQEGNRKKHPSEIPIIVITETLKAMKDDMLRGYGQCHPGWLVNNLNILISLSSSQVSERAERTGRADLHDEHRRGGRGLLRPEVQEDRLDAQKMI